jgi:hypothetical protein
MSSLKGYKTIILAVLSAGAYLLAWPQLTQYIDPQVIAVASAVLMGVMRWLTNSPLFKKA